MIYYGVISHHGIIRRKYDTNTACKQQVEVHRERYQCHRNKDQQDKNRA